MRTNFFCTNFLNTPRGPGHPGKIPRTSQIPPSETQGRHTFEGEHELFGHHPFAWKTPPPPGGLRTQKLNLCALFSCMSVECEIQCEIHGRGNWVVLSKWRQQLRGGCSNDQLDCAILPCLVVGQHSMTYTFSEGLLIAVSKR